MIDTTDGRDSPGSRRTIAGFALFGLLMMQMLGACSALGERNVRTDQRGIRMVEPQLSWRPAPEQVPVTEGFVDVGGARLWYWDTGGAGEAVVFVHPYSGSALIWEYQQPVFAQAGFRVIAYSRRGHYRSDVGDQDNPGTGVDDLYLLLEHLKVDKVHLVGIALGADILPDFAISYPERLLSLTIGSTIGKPGDPAYRASDATLLPPEFRALPTTIKELSPAYRAGNPEGTARWEALEKKSKTRRVPIPAKNEVTPERIASIDIPLMLFTGDSDLYMPPSRLRAYASYWQSPEIAIFREAGHAPYWEQPDAFNNLLVDFLARHPGSGEQRSGLADVVIATTTPNVRVFGQRDIEIAYLPAQTTWQPIPQQAPATEGYVDVDGVKLWYRDTGGDGVPVVLLHPYTGSALTWGYQQPELVAAGCRVISYSRRGHFGSDVGDAENLPSSADDLRAVVKHLELKNFHLVGSGAGGFVALDYAMSYPDEPLSITIATSSGGVLDREYHHVFSNYIRTPAVVDMPHYLKEVGPSYRDLNPEGTKAWIEMERKSVQALLRPPSKNTRQWDQYEALKLPVLLIGADADIYMPPPMLREFAARIEDVEVVMLSESGHSGYWEQPIAFNQALIGFLRRQDRT